jgi:integrase
MKHSDFSVKRVEGFRCQPGKSQSIYWDGYAPGLGLRVTAAGSKSYIFETWLHGRCLRVTIGNQRTWTLGRAQDEATRLKSLTDQGIDPRRIKEQQEAAAEAARLQNKSEATLVAEAWKAYVGHHTKRWGDRHLADHRNLSQPGGEKRKRGDKMTVAGVLHPLMRIRLSDISSAVLIDWQSSESATRANNARQGFELFRTFWRWAATRPEYASVINLGAVDSKDVREEVPARKSKKFDVLQRAQLKSWFGAVRALSNPIISAYLQALILTGARREEMAELRWEDIDFQWQSLWIKDKVAKEGRKIPLSPYLSSLLSALPRKNRWVFSSPTAATGRIAEPRIPHNRALSVAGIDHVTLHGLRRTFASLAEWVEIPRGVVAQIMGHAPNATAEKHYISRPLDLLALWHTKYEAWILEQAGVQIAGQQHPRKTKFQNKKKSEPTALRLVASG